jgi:virginiamycin A acetyltransferase
MIKKILNYIIVKLKNRTSSINSFKVSRIAFIGDNVWIGSNVIIKKDISIKSHSYVNENSILVSGSIGQYCSIGYAVIIGPEEHPLDKVTTSPRAFIQNNIKFEQDKLAPIIGDDVWIGANAVVLRGTIIGKGAVIAAGAIVTKNVEEYSIVGGVPARKISKRLLCDSSWIES